MISQTKISRRRFLSISGGVIGAGIFAYSGLTYQPVINDSETRCTGEEKMSDKILVTYATRAGSTVEVAAAIAKVLCEQGASVDVKPIKHITDIKNYTTVVVGSAIRMGQWLPEAVKFIQTHQPALQQVKTAFFTVCLTLNEDTAENRRKVAEFTTPVRAIHQPTYEAFFAGKMDFNKLSLIDRFIATMVKSPEGDWRNWEQISNWAHQL